MGVADHRPFLAVLLTFHLVVALVVFHSFSPSAPWWGLGAALLILFLGSGADDLFWAFQIGFVASTATGLWALLLLRRLERPADVAASLLLLASLATSGIGSASSRPPPSSYSLSPAGGSDSPSWLRRSLATCCGS